jgi:hypothetical protein
MTGAFQDGSGHVFVMSSRTYRSTDYGQNFTQIQNSGVGQDDLNGVIAAAQNPTDNSIILANEYAAGGNYYLRIWGTRDYGATFSSMKDFLVGGQMFHGAMANIQNLVVLAVTTGTTDLDGTALETGISIMTSYDGGVTWSALTSLVDATSGGAHPTYTIGSLKLTANPNNGRVVMLYSLLNGTTRQGIYLKEFY